MSQGEYAGVGGQSVCAAATVVSKAARTRLREIMLPVYLVEEGFRSIGVNVDVCGAELQQAMKMGRNSRKLLIASGLPADSRDSATLR